MSGLNRCRTRPPRSSRHLILEVIIFGNRKERAQRRHERALPFTLALARHRRGRIAELVELQRRARDPFRLRPVRVHVTPIVTVAGDVRPSVVAARDNQVELVVGAGAVFRRIEQTGRPESQALRIAVAVGVDVTADAVDRRVVGRNGAVEVEPQNFAFVRRPVARRDLCRRGQVLRPVRRAVVLRASCRRRRRASNTASDRARTRAALRRGRRARAGS